MLVLEEPLEAFLVGLLTRQDCGWIGRGRNNCAA